MIQIIPFAQAGTVFARRQDKSQVEAVVADIIADVRKNGDKALYSYCKKFDGASLSSLAVTQEEIDAAVKSLDTELLAILQEAAENIRSFHSLQKRSGFWDTPRPGVLLGQRVIPLDKVGIYVPGGTAAYPSTVLMDSIPAKIAGCGQVVMVTPPDRNGKVNPAILAAAKIAGIDEIYKVGGAQAVAALAYGTESIPRVDKIVGPGNAYVAEAKKQVFGQVAIDMIAGPSEILVVADAAANPRQVAADLLSQAEHDKMASAVLVTDSQAMAFAVSAELERQIPALPRAEIARASIDNNGKIILADSLSQAIEMSNRLAPEHLELCVDDPFALLESVRHAGSVFLGRACPEALGDYFAGPNHTLPTSGTARFSSPLSVDDFVKKMQVTYYTVDALNAVAPKIARFAETEGLSAHARSALSRMEEAK